MRLQRIQNEYNPDHNLFDDEIQINLVDITLCNAIVELQENKLDKGDPLLQYLFNTVAQLVNRVAKLEDKLDFYLKENAGFMMCDDCDRNLADYPSKVCVSCNAYKEHFDYS